MPATVAAPTAQVHAREPNPGAQPAETFASENELNRDQVLALRREYLPPAVFMYYREPVNLVRGHMQYLYDDTGRQYLDALGGIVTISVGHCHPEVIAKTKAQIDKLQHATTIYLHPAMPLLAQKLAEKMPSPDLKVTFFTNSGSETNDLALTMARLFTGNLDVLALRNCYHGAGLATMSLVGHSTWKYPIPTAGNIHHVAPGYCYRCPFGKTYPACDLHCARDVENVIRHNTSGRVAAFIGEPIQGVGGTVTPPPEYFKIVYDIVKKYGGLFIADEVQTGFGRTGSHYWGIQNWGVTPDAITMAKGIGNGIPLSALTTRREIAEAMSQKIWFNTFGGNPVSMVQGLATLEVIDKEGTQANAARVGNYLKEKLTALMDKHRLIGEVRGLGLMLGVELVKDRQSKEPATAETAEVMERTKNNGLLIGKGGLYGNVLRIKPPMCLTLSDADFLIDTLDHVLAEVEAA
ncbi:MAG: aspartate aminotransferase family protein [candidate division KSB1 bacterium]|nr:aspartate aminotransferase family protein [candidate division KSB1 bacterium]MDZ7273398.1 aspartate aminotransferase family protein [candidate division KSB1 bacterium]MDZ7288060.1 aspartate aminotransferase family protein [candidate division KSB1 bacterium]MDZ7300088.1 aspartate aminotransferase family protein [candidate division KSB1 bacterium]MDZ7307212.1 aspartate aminotransferase family protein [candidate division KSB1 bacterium]